MKRYPLTSSEGYLRMIQHPGVCLVHRAWLAQDMISILHHRSSNCQSYTHCVPRVGIRRSLKQLFYHLRPVSLKKICAFSVWAKGHKFVSFGPIQMPHLNCPITYGVIGISVITAAGINTRTVYVSWWTTEMFIYRTCCEVPWNIFEHGILKFSDENEDKGILSISTISNLC